MTDTAKPEPVVMAHPDDMQDLLAGDLDGMTVWHPDAAMTETEPLYPASAIEEMVERLAAYKFCLSGDGVSGSPDWRNILRRFHASRNQEPFRNQARQVLGLEEDDE